MTDLSKEQQLARLGRYHMDAGLKATAAILNRYMPQYEAVCLGFSGGKDSTTMATVMEHLFTTGKVPTPKTRILAQVDTTVELPPLHANSLGIAAELKRRGWTIITRRPKPRERLWVQMLGKGLPPANQRGNWWCTRSTKQDPQNRMYEMLNRRFGRMLVCYGSRVDESDARAARIAQSCTAAGTECGLGLFKSLTNSLAPIVGWRNCAVWDWLMLCKGWTGIDVSSLWEAYAADEAEQMKIDWGSLSSDEADQITSRWDAEIDSTSRTGCVACHIARDDRALLRLCRTKAWGHLKPYQRLFSIVDALRMHEMRVVRPSTGGAGAIQLEARLWALEEVLKIQAEVASGAALVGKPHFDLISRDDEGLIRRMIADETFPRGYGDKPTPMPRGVVKGIDPLPGQAEMAWE